MNLSLLIVFNKLISLSSIVKELPLIKVNSKIKVLEALGIVTEASINEGNPAGCKPFEGK